MKGKGGKSFEAGDLVFAKVRGYPPWPARVINPTAKSGSKYQVFFFGTYETAVCKKEDMWLYNAETKERYGKQKRKGFAEGLLELEQNPEIGLVPPEEGAGPLEPLDSTAETSALDTTADATAGAITDTSTVQTPAAKKPETEQETEIKDEEDDAALTIDETPKKAAASANKTNKRRAEDTPGSAAPPAKKKAAKTPVPPSTPAVKHETPQTPAQETPAAAPPAPTSRSGRVIKAKKFADDLEPQAAPTPLKSASPAPLEKKATPNAKPEPRKMFVHVKDTGDMLEINLNKDRPVKFDSKDAEIQWDKATARNALKFKQSVESGEFIPEEIKKKIEAKSVRTEKEEELLRKEKVLAGRKEKIRWLKVEQRLVDIDIDIKTALHYKRPDMKKCLEHLDELLTMPVAPLMFKKQPDIVTTIRKLRKYIGPEDDPVDKAMAQEWNGAAQKIRVKSDTVFHKIQSCFTVPEGKSFWDAFEIQLTEYRDVTKDMDPEQVIHLVSDPTPSKN